MAMCFRNRLPLSYFANCELFRLSVTKFLSHIALTKMTAIIIFVKLML